MRYKLIVFDLDGTILDSQKGAMDVVNRLLAKRGLPPISSERFRLISNEGAKNLIALAVGIDPETPEADVMLEEFIIEYLADSWAFPFPGIAHLLASLWTRGVVLAILTNKVEQLAKNQLELAGLCQYFEVIVADNGATSLKPDPHGLLRIIDQIGVSQQDTLFVGDSSQDMLTAMNAGVSSSYVTYGIGKLDPKQYKVDYIVDKPEDLLPIIFPCTTANEIPARNSGGMK